MPWYSYSTCSQCSLVGHENPSVLRAKKKNFKGKKKINTVEKSLHHVDKVAKFLDLNSLWPCKRGRKKMTKITCMTFPVHNNYAIIALKNKTVALSSIVRQCKWLSLPRKIVEIQNFCYHGNMTSHFSSPFSALVTERIWIKHYSCPQKQTNQYHNS